MKTPEEMAEEYTKDWWGNLPEAEGMRKSARENFLAGYKAAMNENKPKVQELEANWKFCCEDKARVLNELAAAERAKEQVADVSKVMDTPDSCEHILDMEKMVDVNSPRKLDGWISVKDRLPEDRRRVIYWHDEFGANVGHYDSTYPKQNYHWWSYNFGDSADFRVKWWMPLPKPPKEEK